jgi:hypothetical protein
VYGDLAGRDSLIHLDEYGRVVRGRGLLVLLLLLLLLVLLVLVLEVGLLGQVELLLPLEYRPVPGGDGNSGAATLAKDVGDPADAAPEALTQHFGDAGTGRRRVARGRCVLGGRVLERQLRRAGDEAVAVEVRRPGAADLRLRVPLLVRVHGRTVEQLYPLQRCTLALARADHCREDECAILLRCPYPDTPISLAPDNFNSF